MLNALQITMRHLQEDQYTAEEKLDRLSGKTEELTKFYCKTPTALNRLKRSREKRG